MEEFDAAGFCRTSATTATAIYQSIHNFLRCSIRFWREKRNEEEEEKSDLCDCGEEVAAVALLTHVVQRSRPNISKFQSFNILRSTCLNHIKFTNLQIWRLSYRKMFGRVIVA